jgi:hypothetical protein
MARRCGGATTGSGITSRRSRVTAAGGGIRTRRLVVGTRRGVAAVVFIAWRAALRRSVGAIPVGSRGAVTVRGTAVVIGRVTAAGCPGPGRTIRRTGTNRLDAIDGVSHASRTLRSLAAIGGIALSGPRSRIVGSVVGCGMRRVGSRRSCRRASRVRRCRRWAIQRELPLTAGGRQ